MKKAIVGAISQFLSQFTAFWAVVILLFISFVGLFVSHELTKEAIWFVSFGWGVVAGILAEKGGLHPFKYPHEQRFRFVLVGDKCNTCEPIQALKDAVEKLGGDVSIRNTEIIKKSLW